MKSFSISQFKHPIFLLIFGLLLCMATTLHFLSAKQKQETLQEQIRFLNRKHLANKKKNEREGLLTERLKKANPDYVQNRLEKLTFLEAEAKRIEALLLDHPYDKTPIKRLKFLKEGSNQLKFQEKNFQRALKLQEVDVIQEHPIEMGKEDLMKLLSKIEHVEIGPFTPDPDAPDFLIERFELTRKPLSSEDEVFMIKLNCIKREYVHE